MERRPGKNLVLGVDIGGTKVAAGLVNSRGEVLVTARARMVTNEGPQEGLQAVLDAITEVLASRRAKDACAIGVSVPGWVDSDQGVLLGATNLPCWRNYPLKSEIEARFHLPTRLANDANVAALAEAVWGAGSGFKNVFYVSLGTGIGTGLVLQHRIYYGRTGAAGEGGHMTIDYRGPLCGCGKRGCIEMYASGTAIARRARARLANKRAQRSHMMALALGQVNAVTSEIVGKAAMAGDALAIAVLEEAADHLAIWLGNIIDLLEPEIIVIGGGLGHLMASFLGHMKQRLETWAINPRRGQIPIVSAVYGAESGLVGSAALCLPRTRLWLARPGRGRKGDL